MDQMTFNLNWGINEVYLAGMPVIVLSNEGKAPHGRRELEACVRSGSSVSSAVIRGIKAEEWVKSVFPEAMEAVRQVFYVQQAVDGHIRTSPDGSIADEPDYEQPAETRHRESPRGT